MGFTKAIEELLATYPSDGFFPMGDDPIPTGAESRIHEWIADAPLITRDQIASVRSGLTRNQAYNLVGFSLRSLVRFAREQNPERMPSVLFALVVDDDLVDWRDMLGALSIAEDCLRRHDHSFSELITALRPLASERRQSTIDGYLSRSAEMRSPEVMGFSASGNEEEFTYVHA